MPVIHVGSNWRRTDSGEEPLDLNIRVKVREPADVVSLGFSNDEVRENLLGGQVTTLLSTDVIRSQQRRALCATGAILASE